MQRGDRDDCIHHRIEATAAARPGAVAIVTPGAAIRLGALNRRANRLAWMLRDRGVARGDLIAICDDFGIHLVVGMLAILKAGAAYVPLDPAHPPDRLRAMLAGAGNCLLIARDDLDLGAVASPVVRQGAQRAAIARFPATDPPPLNTPDDLVYCLFTSGSTGTPKGALNRHLGLANLCRWYAGAEAGGGPAARTMVISSIGFDLTQKNIWEPLASAGTILFGSPGLDRPAAMAAMARRHRPTRLNGAPSAFERLAESVLVDSVEIVILGGEPVGAALARRITDAGARVVNSYGPTECSDVALAQAGLAPGDAFMPLGAPIAGVEIALVDAQMAPIGGAGEGELLIAGVGVGAGYLGDPEQTEQRFIADPARGAVARRYRTGDIVRRDDDGRLWYVGRRDQQVKIGGNRIELREVEAALAAHPGVAQAAVVAFALRTNEQRLCAFLVAADPKRPPTTEALRGFAAARLPGFMIPAHWQWRPALPLNASGKIDRLALILQASTPRAGAGSVPPASPVERTIADIWATLFEVGAIGADADFLALGGDSLAALSMALAVQQRLGVEVSLGVIFEHRTVRAFAAWLALQLAAGGAAPAGASAAPLRGSYQPTPGQCADLGATTSPLSFMKLFTVAFRIAGGLDRDRLRAAIDAVIARQEALRTCFERRDDAPPIARIRQAASIDLTVFPRRDDPTGEALPAWLRRVAFDPGAPPLVKVATAVGESGEAVVALALDPLIADAWSLSLLTRQIGNSYGLGAEAASRPGEARFSDFVGHGDAGEASVSAYWRDLLADPPAPPTLPWAQRPRPPVFSGRGAAIDLAFDPVVADALRRACAAMGVTPYAILLTALFVTLHESSGARDLIVRSPASWRPAAAAGVIGPFGAAMPIRLVLPTDTSPRALIGIVRAQIEAARRHLSPGSDAAIARHAPAFGPGQGGRFPIVCNHHNYPPHPTHWGALALTEIAPGFTAIKADLAVHSWFDGTRLSVVVAYYADLVTRAEAEAVATGFQGALTRLIAAAI